MQIYVANYFFIEKKKITIFCFCNIEVFCTVAVTDSRRIETVQLIILTFLQDAFCTVAVIVSRHTLVLHIMFVQIKTSEIK